MSDAEVKHVPKLNGIYDILDYIRAPPNTLQNKCSSPADLVILGQTYHIPDHQEAIESDPNNEDTTDNSARTVDDSGEIQDEDSTYDQCDIHAIGKTPPGGGSCDTGVAQSNTPLNNLRQIFNKFTSLADDRIGKRGESEEREYPEEFLDDLNSRLWFTYRFGFPLIERDKNGPAPLSLGSLLRGNLDLGNIGKGFTTDSGWGCMVRTSQSLLGNAMLSLKLGRDWRISTSSPVDMDTHWNIVEQFADTPDAKFSIQRYVLCAAKYCGKKPGEWFGPSNAAKSIQKLCEESFFSKLRVYISTDSGDIFEDELLEICSEKDSTSFVPTLILCGVRLGLQTINPVYWDFLKFVLRTEYGVGISGGRPSSSHYFYGYQSDCLFYLDPHTPQPAILLDGNGSLNEEQKSELFKTLHTTRIRTLDISKVDPSMLIGFLVKSKQDYMALKDQISSFGLEKRFLNIFESRPPLLDMASAGSELDGFIDLGVESLEEDDTNLGIDEVSVRNSVVYDGNSGRTQNANSNAVSSNGNDNHENPTSDVPLSQIPTTPPLEIDEPVNVNVFNNEVVLHSDGLPTSQEKDMEISKEGMVIITDNIS